MRTRQNVLDRLTERGDWNGVVVIGGGINGIGVYRDLAAQGIPALLVEKNDFSSGTSSAPSRLIHGGLRYLETGEFALVRESVEERNHMLLNAPHLIRPIPVWVPMASYGKGLFGAALRFMRLKKDPGPKGALLIKIGLTIFDWFGRVRKTMPSHRMVSGGEVSKTFPGLAPDIKAVAEYYDARLTSPERLAIELIDDAEADQPESLAISYMAATRSKGGRLSLTDGTDGRRLDIAPSLVINCAGPWLDEVHDKLGIRQGFVGGTKGSHLIVRKPELAAELGERMVYFETGDHRACLIYATDADHCLLGTTDIRTDDPSDNVCSDEEIDYLFAVLADIMPGRKLKRDDIVFTYAGVRPLPKSGDGSTGAISRDHSFHVFEPEDDRTFPIISLIGGKWTTFRSCAEELVDLALKQLGTERRRSTLDLAIGGGKGMEGRQEAIGEIADRLTDEFLLTPLLSRNLARRYGSAARAMLDRFSDDDFSPLANAETYMRGEIRHAARHDRVTHLDDILLRRTEIPFEGGANASTVREIGQIAGETLGWEPAKVDEEIERCVGVLKARHRVHGELSASDAPERSAG